MQTVTKGKIHIAIELEKAEIKRQLWGGKIEAEIDGRIPTVFVGQVSARRWSVGWNYQPKDTENGATIQVPHPEEFIGDVIACK